MNPKELLLLRTLLRSTSSLNAAKHAKDSKKRGKAIGAIVSYGVLFLLLLAYVILMCVGFWMQDLIQAVPYLCGLMIVLIAFIFTLFKTNGYLFAFKEYDMLMAMPFETKTVARAKFLYMYIESLVWYGSISVAMLIGYGIFARPALYVYPMWLFLSLILPILPMLLASFLGYGIAKIGAGRRNGKVLQMVFTIGIAVVAFGLRFFIEDIFEDEKIGETLLAAYSSLIKLANVVLPVKWFAEGAVFAKGWLSSSLLLVGATLIFLELVFIPVSKSYRKINSDLMTAQTKAPAKAGKIGKKSVVVSIALKEWRRMTGSVTYMTNVFLGEIFALIIGIAVIVLGTDGIVDLFMHGAEIELAYVVPGLVMLIYMFIGMMPSTACSPSLEGKNAWIPLSLPISSKTLYQGKLLFGIVLSVPFALFATLAVCISAGIGLLNTLELCLLMVVLCAFSNCFGLLCGVKFLKLGWENEIEVIKQGKAVTIYLLPNLFGTMILMVAIVAATIFLGPHVTNLGFCLIFGLLAWTCYIGAMKTPFKMA